MLTYDVPRDATDDGYNHRPELYDSKTGSFDFTTFKERMERNDRLRMSKPGIIFAGIFSNEIDFTQFFFCDPITREPLRVWFFQIPMFLENDFLGFCGRDIGKSFMLKLRMLHRAVSFPGGSAILATFDQAHTNKLTTEMFDMLDTHPVLSLFKDTSSGSRSRRHPYNQRFTNDYVWWGLAAGEHSHRSLESPHVMSLFGDEWQYFPREGWRKLQPAINDQLSNRRYGSCRILVGVNAEGRTDTVYYELAFDKDSQFKGHVYRFASWYHMRDYTYEKHKDYLKDYGGSINASEFKQMIRGMVGEQAKGAIPEDLYNEAVNFGKLLDLETRVCRINKQTWEAKNQNLTDILGARFLDHPATDCMLTADYGYSAPTEIGIWYLMDSPKFKALPDDYSHPKWALWARISLVRIEPAMQAHIFDELATVYDPILISIDSTASTNPVTTVLTDQFNTLYNDPVKNYKERVFEAKFNGETTVRYELEKPSNAGKEYKAVRINGEDMFALRAPANEYATVKIVELLYERKLALPEDEAMRKDCLGMTEIRSGRQVQYKGTPQHIVSMIRAFSLAYHSMFTLKELEAQMTREDSGAVGIIYGTSVRLVPDEW